MKLLQESGRNIVTGASRRASDLVQWGYTQSKHTRLLTNVNIVFPHLRYNSFIENEEESQ